MSYFPKRSENILKFSVQSIAVYQNILKGSRADNKVCPTELYVLFVKILTLHRRRHMEDCALCLPAAPR